MREYQMPMIIWSVENRIRSILFNEIFQKQIIQRFENPCSILTPPTRLSTASTLQSARINDNGQSQQNGTLFRPSLNLRRQNLAAKGNNINKGSPANILELEGICLDEKGILAEESEGEIEEEELQKNERSHENDNQRRASTSAKSRDSGISY